MIDRRSATRSQDQAGKALLPHYLKPPLIEVAMSVQFDELPGFQPIHFGLLWERWRARYPRYEHKPPLGSTIELFGVRGAQIAKVTVADAEFPVGRYWYLSEDGHRLIQVQPDKFVLNWRKLDEHTEYPRYESLKTDFIEELQTFLAFVAESELGEFEPTQAELTYVNHLGIDDEQELGGHVSRFIAAWSMQTSDDYLPDVEDLKLAWQYKFEEAQKPIGRLHVKVQTARRATDQRRLLTLQLTGRGSPLGPGVDGVLALTDKAHEWIVRGFTSLTTAQMHALWERQQ